MINYKHMQNIMDFKDREMSSELLKCYTKKMHPEIQFDCTHLIRSASVSVEREWMIHCEMCLKKICNVHISIFHDFSEI